VSAAAESLPGVAESSGRVVTEDHSKISWRSLTASLPKQANGLICCIHTCLASLSRLKLVTAPLSVDGRFSSENGHEEIVGVAFFRLSNASSPS
jgi:hypothetical protein